MPRARGRAQILCALLIITSIFFVTESAQAAPLRPGKSVLIHVRGNSGPGKFVSPGLRVVQFKNKAELAKVYADDRVTKVAPNYFRKLQAVPGISPRDPLFDTQWGLGAIGATLAWTKGTGSKNVVVAVIDDGLELTHPDIQNSVWTNPGEVPGNGVDDDQNGFIDDVHGWDFIGNDNNPQASLEEDSTYGHGTHVSGIIGATGNNDIGVSGINWRSSIIPVRVCGADGCPSSAIIAGIRYAAQNGAKIANISLGGPEKSPEEGEALRAADKMLVVAAAGNEGADTGQIPSYPAAWNFSNMISVAALDQSGELAGYSNRGVGTMIAAPGSDIKSTVPFGTWGLKDLYVNSSGTSMASPHVAGSAALLAAQNPAWSIADIRRALLFSARRQPHLSQSLLIGGALDLGKASGMKPPFSALLVTHTTGSGSGTVQAGSTCTERLCRKVVPQGSSVALVPKPASGSVFKGFTGGCTSSPCVVQDITSVRAEFQLKPNPKVSDMPTPVGRKLVLGSTSRWLSHYSFSKLALSADGLTRAVTIDNEPEEYDKTSEHPCISREGVPIAAVYIETRSKVGAAWQQKEMLTSPQVGPYDSGYGEFQLCYGWGGLIRLSADGSRLLVGKYPETNSNNCYAYLYRKVSGSWEMYKTFTPSKARMDQGECLGWGEAGDLSGDGKTVALPNVDSNTGYERVQIFKEGSKGWSSQEVSASWGSPEAVHSSGRFGDFIDLSADGKTLALGQPSYTEKGKKESLGRVNVYKLTSSWKIAKSLLPPDSIGSVAYIQLGASVSLSSNGDTLVAAGVSRAGAPEAAGFAVVYQGLVPQAILSAPSGQVAAEDLFGSCQVNYTASKIACRSLGAVGWNPSQGSVYVFNKSSSWTNTVPARYTSNRGQPYDFDLANVFITDSLGPIMNSTGSIIDVPTGVSNALNGTQPDTYMGFEIVGS